MIPNKNYNPEKIAEYAMQDAEKRHEDMERRKLSMQAIRNQDPSYRETPDLEGIVDISEPMVCPQCDESADELITLTQFLTLRATVDIKVCQSCYERILNT